MSPLKTLKTFLTKFFFGSVVLEECDSEINGKITVCEDLFNKKRLMVGGLTQSGKLVEELWEKAISKLKNEKTERPKNTLILGLGAGSVAKLINQKYPDVKIVGIEIDPEIIRLGKKYFGLSEVKNLEMLVADALSIIHNSEFIIQNFDLILVDLYLGDQVPPELDSELFLKGLKQRLNQNCIVIFNRLNYGQKVDENKIFQQKLRKNYNNIKDLSFRNNRLFFCSNSSGKL